MMTPEYAHDGVDDDGSEMTVWGVEYRHALKRLAEAKAREDETRRTADVSAALRAPRLVQDAQALVISEAETCTAASRFFDAAHHTAA